jgi:hypothetical protein
MATVRTPAGTRIYMQSAISAAQSITGITKAAPPVVTYSGADTWTNGNYIALSDMFGMTDFEDSLCRVAAVNTTSNTLELEDQDSTGYGTFVSGNGQLVTMATEIQAATGFSMSGGDQQFAEYTFLWDKITRKFPTTKAGGQVNLSCVWDPNDAGLIAIQAASDTASKLGFKIVFPDGLELLFFGYIGSAGLPKADNANSIMTTDVSINIASRIRYAKP